MNKNDLNNKICIFGGTFNPIHIGHLEMAKKAKDIFGFDKIIFIPTGDSYLKKDVLDAEIRFSMVKLAISEYDYFEISDIELNREGASYTYETLEQIRSSYSNEAIYMLIGEDSLRYIRDWKKPDVIFDLAHVIVARREMELTSNLDRSEFYSICDSLNKEFNTKIVSFDFSVDISSSKIRQSFFNGSENQIKNYLPLNVYNYIKDNNLYNH